MLITQCLTADVWWTPKHLDLVSASSWAQPYSAWLLNGHLKHFNSFVFLVWHHSLHPKNDKVRQPQHHWNSGLWSSPGNNSDVYWVPGKQGKLQIHISGEAAFFFHLHVSQPFHCLKSSFIQNAAHSFCFISLHISCFTKFDNVCFELCSVSSLSCLLPNPSHLSLPIRLP